VGYTYSSYQIADLAVEIETEGAKYYRRVAALVEDEGLRQTFGRLADLEAEHRATFLAMAEELKDKDKTYEYVIDLEGLMRANVEAVKQAFWDAPSLAQGAFSLKEAFFLAIRLEEGSIRVYSQIREKFIDRFSGILDKIIDEEKEHLKLFTGMRDAA